MCKPKQQGAILVSIPGHATEVLLPDPGDLDAKAVRYVLADASVALAVCPQCQAPVGRLCAGPTGALRLSTHWLRRQVAAHARRVLRAAGKFSTAYRIVYVCAASSSAASLPSSSDSAQIKRKRR